MEKLDFKYGTPDIEDYYHMYPSLRIGKCFASKIIQKINNYNKE